MILFNQYQNHGFVCWSSILIFIPSSPGLSFRSGTISDKFFEEGSVQCKQQKEKDMDMDWAEIIIDRWFGIWMMIKDRKMSVVVKKIFLFCKKSQVVTHLALVDPAWPPRSPNHHRPSHGIKLSRKSLAPNSDTIGPQRIGRLNSGVKRRLVAARMCCGGAPGRNWGSREENGARRSSSSLDVGGVLSCILVVLDTVAVGCKVDFDYLSLWLPFQRKPCFASAHYNHITLKKWQWQIRTGSLIGWQWGQWKSQLNAVQMFSQQSLDSLSHCRCLSD